MLLFVSFFFFVLSEDFVYEDDLQTILKECNCQQDEVTIPDQVKIILPNAFTNCLSRSIIFSSTSQLIEVKPYAFSRSAIVSVQFPDSLQSLGFSAFESSTVVSVDLGSSLSEIKPFVFRNCEKLVSLKSGASSLLENSVLNLVNSRIVSLRSGAFIGVKIDSVVVPESFPICDMMFKETSVKSVTFNGDISLIPSKFFSGCRNLISVSIKNVYILSDGALNFNSVSIESIGSKAFSEVPLKSVDVPNNVKSVSVDAFEKCFNLESISLPQFSLMSFRNFNKISNVNLGNITLIKEGTVNFSQSSVSSIDDFLFTNSSISEVFIPSTITSIGTQLFAFCKNLKRVTIAGKLSEIPFGLFQETPSLTYISIGGNIILGNNVIDFSVSSISKVFDLAFSRVGSITRVVFGAGDISFDAYALSSNPYLTHVEFRDVPFNFVSQHLFWDCPKLQTLELTGPYDCTFYSVLDFKSVFRRTPLEKLEGWCEATT